MNRRSYGFLGVLAASYIGVYLCRKNLTVAVPLLQSSWGLSKEEVGTLASVSTLAYAVGKIGFGPLVDRLGGRTSLLCSMTAVALFGALGGFMPGLGSLVVVYSLNRLAGSASWGAMVKLTPDWFPPWRLPFAIGLLALSYVFGGALAVSGAGLIASATGDNWRWVMSLPAAALAIMVVVCWVVLPRGPLLDPGSPSPRPTNTAPPGPWIDLLRDRRFIGLCALSFTLTLMRETFNFWTVDFLRSEGGAHLSSMGAALLSMPFDLCGAAGILTLSSVYGRLRGRARPWTLFLILSLLSVVLLLLPWSVHLGVGPLSAMIGLTGFLVYGPYSLLSGVLAVELQGQGRAATVAGFVDGIGYVAGILSGVVFGRLLAIGGYTLGYQVLAFLTLGSGCFCFMLYPKHQAAQTSARSEATPPPPPGDPLPSDGTRPGFRRDEAASPAHAS